MGSSLEMHPVERTLYSPVLKFLDELGFVGIQEIKKGSNYVDILFEYGRYRFILEVKIDRKSVSDPLVDGIVQAYKYGLEFNTTNLIVILYPSSVSENIQNIIEVTQRARTSKVEAVILTKYWHDHKKRLNIEEILSNLKNKFDQEILAVVRVETVSVILQKGVRVLSRLLNKYYKDEKSIQEIANHLTEDYGLFIKLSSSRITKSRMRNQTIDLLAYILVNQIIFYFLYSKKSQDMEETKRVPEIKALKHLNDLSEYFDRIRNIDYRPIFDILVVQRIPSNIEIVEQVNKLIECLTPLKISEMRHDIYGRLIGSSLPKETKELLASYYTKTSSADLLANLTIDSYSNTVWDLACGSGTLLVSSYDAKMKLYQKEKRITDPADQDKLHVRFVEQEITGTDIMPFACHLTGLNLSAKNLKKSTNFLRISTMNSLRIESLEQSIWVEEAYGDISRELERLRLSQQTMDQFTGRIKTREIQPRKFQLEKVDRVVVNPPFTSINKIPDSYRYTFTSSSLSKVCGKRIHLWGHFLALADVVLKDGGKVGAIIPISLLHGRDTHKLRNYYLNNYSIEYIIKPTRGRYFSEGSNFKDIIFIARKVKPDRNHKVRILCLKTDIDDFGRVEIETLSKNIKTELEDVVNNDEYLLYLVDQKELQHNKENLMSYVFTNDGELKKLTDKIIKRLRTNPILIKTEKKNVRGGQQLRPKGEYDRNVITRHYSDSRVKHSSLIFKEDDNLVNSLEFFNKETNRNETKSKSQLVKTFRTLNGIDMIDATSLHDYIIKEKLTIKEKVHLLIPKRFQLNSSETFLTAVYVKEPICPMDMFMMYQSSNEDAKILSVYFNSIFYLIQLLMYAKQSTRAYLEMKQIDLFQVLIPDIKKLNKKNCLDIINFFKKYKHIKLESIPAQLVNKSEYRLFLDETIAENLGIKITRKELIKIYNLIWNQIKNLP